ncbi:MAG: tripartite tricarboxylate transporter substrate binding protein [Pseudomonadota bacterium]|nr:tripartite tricarboxylate transporter substrate binding protein [Pseudomonadota bacterium]
MQFTRRSTLGLMGATSLVSGLGLGTARAQEAYPLRRLTLVVPFDAGGSADRMARAIANYLPEELGVPVQVVNRTGGSGALGHSWFVRQPDDGSFALVSPTHPYLISNVLQGQANLAWEDFHHINGQWQDYYAILVNNAQPYETMAELIADIRDNPGKVSCAIIPGDGGHLSAVILLERLGIPKENVNWVTYDGGGPMRTAIAGDQTTMTFISALGSTVIQDQVKALAIYRDEPHELWDAPPINEALAETGVEVPVMPADLRTLTVQSSFREKHPDRYQMLVEAYQRMLQREDFRAFIVSNAIGGQWMGPESTAQALQDSYDMFAEYIDQL